MAETVRMSGLLPGVVFETFLSELPSPAATASLCLPIQVSCRKNIMTHTEYPYNYNLLDNPEVRSSNELLFQGKVRVMPQLLQSLRQ
jgi:hypothetical protein